MLILPVELTHADWAVIEERLREIVASHTKGAGKRDRNCKVDTARNDHEIHRAGIVGEVAFSKWSGLPLMPLKRRGGDGNGPDFWFNRNEGINVKTTASNRNLLPRKGAPLNATHYGLLWWDSGNFVRLVGWIDRSELLAAGMRRDFGIGEQLYYPFDKLVSFEELEAAVGGWIRMADERLR